MTDVLKLIPRRAVASRLGVHIRTIIRRENEDPNFPKPVTIKNRRFFRESEVVEYVTNLIHKGMEPPEAA